MNLSTGGAGSRTVEAFVSHIDEEADPAGQWFRARATSLGGRDHEKASVTQLGHRQVSRTHSSVPVVAQYTHTAQDAPLRANFARHPEPASVLIHIV